jgi:predicted ATPase
MFIKELKIRNFRSLAKTDIPLNNMSVFVGFNDVGKSNILKALNLFFNNETDYEKPLFFTEDYSKYAPIRKKKAEEIIIELIINAPKNYKESKDIRWTKVWRESGIFRNEITFIDGTSFPPKSKLNSWSKNIRYTYVPAIRGASYFQILLAKLHDSLAETIEVELRTAGDDFINKIKLNTEEMTNEIFKRMEIKSQIRFPSNLQALFRTLDFATDDGAFDISLSNRGDGIKTRYIPAILRFISDQLNINKVKGAPNIIMIWGYEEPENNLEMLASFKLAEQFVEYSKDIQLLVTTHSPGFYSLKSKHVGLVNLFKVIKDSGKEAQITSLDSHSTLDTDMGLMPLITPYIQEKILEIEKLKEDNKRFSLEIEAANKHVIFVEGDDEVRVFSAIVSKSVLSNYTVVKRDGFGCNGVKNFLMSWSWISGTTSLKTIGLFDNDPSGNSALKKLREEDQYKNALNSKVVKAINYKVPPHLRNIKSKIHDFPIEIEEMYPPKVWEHAKLKNYLIKRDISELSSFVNVDHADQTITDKINSLGFDPNELNYVLNKVPDNHKDKLSKHVIKLTRDSLDTEKLGPIINFFNSEILPFLRN